MSNVVVLAALRPFPSEPTVIELVRLLSGFLQVEIAGICVCGSIAYVPQDVVLPKASSGSLKALVVDRGADV